jgi:hypothetical protein
MRTAIIVAALVMSHEPIIGADFLDRLNDDQRTSYLNGVVEMLAYDLSTRNHKQQSSCLTDWYYRGAGPGMVAEAIRRYRDLPVVGVLKLLVQHVCSTTP